MAIAGKVHEISLKDIIATSKTQRSKCVIEKAKQKLIILVY